MKEFIIKVDGSNYYLIDEGYVIEGSLNPPNNPEEKFSIIEVRGGRRVFTYSLREALNHQKLPAKVREVAQGTIKQHPPQVTEEWVVEVYKTFGGWYSPDGISRKVTDICPEGKPEHNLGYLYVKDFFPEHQPITDLP